MSKYQTTIKLMKKNEDGKYKQVQFKSAEFLPGPVVEEAAEVMEVMQNAVDKKSVSEALVELIHLLQILCLKDNLLVKIIVKGLMLEKLLH